MTIKGQALADFIIECSFSKPDSSDQPGEVVSSVTNAQTAQTSWTLYVDGSTTLDFNGAGVILTSPEEFRVQSSAGDPLSVQGNQQRSRVRGDICQVTVGKKFGSLAPSHLQRFSVGG